MIWYQKVIPEEKLPYNSDVVSVGKLAMKINYTV